MGMTDADAAFEAYAWDEEMAELRAEAIAVTE